MTVRIEDNKIVGDVTVTGQFLHGTKDVNGFQVRFDLDGVDVETLALAAIKHAVIPLRKKVKTVEQAKALADGIRLEYAIGKQPKDANSMAQQVNVDELNPDVAEALLKKLAAKMGMDLE